jgi:hypothetical protein
MPRFKPDDIDRKRKALLRKDMKTTAAMLDELMTMLRQQEYRLHLVERAVDGWSVEDDGSRSRDGLLANFEERLQNVQEACPWDDDNEQDDSWFFTEEEAMHPVRIRKD